MIETVSLHKDQRLRAWRPELDFNRWIVLLSHVGGIAAQALPQFADEIGNHITSFIGELRPGQTHQLLRPYSYEFPEMSHMTGKRTLETVGLDSAHQRAAALQSGIDAAHEYFRTHGEGSQVMLMSPVSEADSEPEFEHTALYWQMYRNGTVEAWQLFVDLSKDERMALMNQLAQNNRMSISYQDDIDCASNPIFLGMPFETVYKFVEAISGQSSDHAKQFVDGERTKESGNQREAKNWVESYVRAIAQGSIELGKQIVTKLQMKVLGVTESMVRSAARSLSIDLSTLQLFLKACGFLEFSFATGGERQSLFVPMVGLGACQEKICNRCGTHAGDHDTTCPSCGWSP